MHSPPLLFLPSPASATPPRPLQTHHQPLPSKGHRPHHTPAPTHLGAANLHVALGVVAVDKGRLTRHAALRGHRVLRPQAGRGAVPVARAWAGKGGGGGAGHGCQDQMEVEQENMLPAVTKAESHATQPNPGRTGPCRRTAPNKACLQPCNAASRCSMWHRM